MMRNNKNVILVVIAKGILGKLPLVHRLFHAQPNPGISSRSPRLPEVPLIYTTKYICMYLCAKEGEDSAVSRFSV